MKAYTCEINGGFVYRLNSIRLKKNTAHAHLNRSVGPYIMYIEDMLWSFDKGISFCELYNKRET